MKSESNNDGYNVDEAINTMRTCHQDCVDEVKLNIMKQKHK